MPKSNTNPKIAINPTSIALILPFISELPLIASPRHLIRCTDAINVSRDSRA